jgi:hypothetical protein
MGLPLQIYYSRGPIGGICFLAVVGFEKSTENTQDSEQYAVFCRMGKVLINCRVKGLNNKNFGLGFLILKVIYADIFSLCIRTC